MFRVKKATGTPSYKMSTSFQSLEKEGEDLLGSKTKKSVVQPCFCSGMSHFKIYLDMQLVQKDDSDFLPQNVCDKTHYFSTVKLPQLHLLIVKSYKLKWMGAFRSLPKSIAKTL